MFCWTAPSWMRFCASGLSPPDESQLAARVDVAQQQIRERLLDLGARLGPLGLVAEAHDDVGPFARDAGVLHLLFAQQRADVGGVAVARLVERGLHVDLQQEMHAAAQIEPQVHRLRADRRQPLRRRRQQVQRDDVVRAELRLQRVLRLQLRLEVGEAHLDAGWIEAVAAIRDRRRLQRVLDRRKERAVDLHAGFRRGNLDRGHLGEEIRHRVDDARDERDGDDQVFPERVSIHGAGERGGGRRGAQGRKRAAAREARVVDAIVTAP